MKLRGSRPGYQHTHVGEDTSPAGIILLLCLYLLGAAMGCYLAKGISVPMVTAEVWLKICACMDGMTIALAILLSWMRIYPLLPLLLLPLKGLLTSGWVVWQCTGSAINTYLRCCIEYGLFAVVSLLCVLVAFRQGMSMYLRPGKRGRNAQTSAAFMGILCGLLLIAVAVQNQICRWL